MLLALWSVWLLAALPVLGPDRRGVWLLLTCVPLGAVFIVWTHVAWRGYLIIWLAVHALFAALVTDRLDRRQIPMSAVSLCGLLWVWGDGGWPDARPIATGAVIAAIIAALMAAGFWACWWYAVRPMRARAVRSEQALARARAAHDTERTAWDSSRAAGLLRIENLTAQVKGLRATVQEEERRRQAREAELRNQLDEQSRQRRRHERELRDWERTREKLTGALREARRADTERRDGDTDPSATGENGVTFVRTSVYTVPAAEVRGGGPVSPDLVDLVVERAEVTVPRDHGDVEAVVERGKASRDDPVSRQRFFDATAGYFGDRIGDSAFEVTTRTWMTSDPIGVNDVAQTISQADTWLHHIVGTPLSDAGRALGVQDPAAQVIGGIGANFVLAPVDLEVGQLIRAVEIVGIAAGVALGWHPLAIACTKSFVHARLNTEIAKGIEDALCDLSPAVCDRPDDPAPARTLEEPAPARTLEEPDAGPCTGPAPPERTRWERIWDIGPEL